MSLGRDALGFALAPLPVVLPFMLLFGYVLIDVPSDGPSAIEALIEIIAACYGATLLIGVPVHVVLRRLKLDSLGAYLSGALVGVVAVGGSAAIVSAMTPPPKSPNPFAIPILTITEVLAGLALVCASVFWLVAVRAR